MTLIDEDPVPQEAVERDAQWPDDAPPAARVRHRARNWAAVVAVAGVAALVAVVLAGGGTKPATEHGAPAGAGSTGTSPSSAGRPAALPAQGAGGATSAGSTGSAASGGSPVPAGTAVLPDEVPSLPTRVIKTGSVALLVRPGRVEIALSAVTSEADVLGGFVSNSAVQNPGPAPGTGTGSAPSPTGSVTVRVPVASFQTMVGYVENLGTVSSASTSGQDVTASYVDLQARITALQDARAQFEQILARATAIGDILSVESQINDTETQVEQLQGQLQVLDGQTTYSTLTVSVAEQITTSRARAAAPHPGGLQRAWDHARHSFVGGIEAVVGAMGGIAVFILFAGLALVAGWGAWKAIGRPWLRPRS